jgi:tetratricopeptide (TPR) repeat protein
MRRIIFLSILVLSACLAAGCFSPTGIVAPMANNPPVIFSDSSVHTGGSTLAIAFEEEGIATNSPEAMEQFRKGLDYMSRYGQYNDSLACFDAALAIDGNFTAAWLAKGVALHNLQRYDEAISCYDHALAINPAEASIWHLKGATLADAGKTDEAAECDRKAAELDPRYGSG